MIVAYPMECEVFGSACEQFELLLSRLIGVVAGHMEHDPIEALIFGERTETAEAPHAGLPRSSGKSGTAKTRCDQS